ncbi:hypothetical protein B0T17DRAFT_517640 [Bombardia bombarda]|uniref:G-patch domain-containing protein n=1 Tax=Bombardia bombarda TaxID=252184 RepID=A0AA39XKX5_9PEZI|nr:hypothetical protein B0T17DRAFT_517640 [Bombardia bombarda]
MATPARGGLSLYANLLNEANNTDSSASTSAQPVLFSENSQGDTPAKRPIDPALRFQPTIRRPQAKQANKPKPGFPKAPPAGTAAASSTGGNGAPQQQQRSTLADWAATEEDEFLYGGGGKQRYQTGRQQQQRGGRRKKKKKTDDAPPETDWDELYDPARPTNVEEYLRSDERIRELKDWRDVLYAHRRRRESSYDEDRSMGGRSNGEEDYDEEDRRPGMGNQFAPPAALSFAPPPVSPPRANTAAAPIPDDPTGDDAYARRLALSGMAPPPPASLPPPPPPPTAPATTTTSPTPATTDSATISRAPVRYEAPPTAPPAGDEMDLDEDEDDEELQGYNYIPPPIGGPDATTTTAPEEEAPRTRRPGQAGFAQRLMSKYGWTAGSGLGADEGGITSALRVQVEKRRKRPDSEGGGFAGPGGRGKIIGGAVKKKTTPAGAEGGEADGGVGKTSEVLVLQNMLEGMPDLAAEIEAGLGQEIGEECGEKYGRVERLYIEPESRQVFIKFTDGVSALRAVNALQGRIFNGNAITAKFYDTEKFEKGVY